MSKEDPQTERIADLRKLPKTEGRYLGVAQDAREIAKALTTGDQPIKPRSISVSHGRLIFKYSEAVFLQAIYRVERMMKKDDLAAKDLVLLTKEARELVQWAREHYGERWKRNGTRAIGAGEEVKRGPGRPRKDEAAAPAEDPEADPGESKTEPDLTELDS